MTIALILEDEPLIAIDVEMSLETAGYQVATLASCSEANEWLDKNRPDVAIVDILLRDGSSESVAARLIEQGIPFVVHSGDVATQFEGTPFSQGTWLPKPSGASELKAAIADAMQRLASGLPRL